MIAAAEPIEPAHGVAAARDETAPALLEIAQGPKTVVLELEEPPGIVEWLLSPGWDDRLHARRPQNTTAAGLADGARRALAGALRQLDGSRGLVIALAEGRVPDLVLHVLEGQITPADEGELARLRLGLDCLAGRRQWATQKGSGSPAAEEKRSVRAFGEMGVTGRFVQNCTLSGSGQERRRNIA